MDRLSKHDKLVSEPMGDKLISRLPGIGGALRKRLEAAGYFKAHELLDQYIVLKKNAKSFYKWMKDTCSASKRQSQDCYKCLSDWYEKWIGSGGEARSRPDEMGRGQRTETSMGFSTCLTWVLLIICTLLILFFSCTALIIERQEQGNCTIGFWNVAGLKGKNEDFRKAIAAWDVTVLCETWVTHDNWPEMKSQLPEGYKWTCQGATKTNGRRGRAKGGLVIGVREEMVYTDEVDGQQIEGLMTTKIKVGEETLTIVGVYVNGDIDDKLISIRRCIEEQSQENPLTKMIIGGDFNARTGNTGGVMGGTRESKDSKINPEGGELTQTLRELGWSVLNGTIKGDEQGEYTFNNGRFKTVIDYVLVNDTTRRGIEKMVIGDKMTSDHHPLVVTMK